MTSDGGKGSTPRPYSVDHDTYVDNWDRIFGKRQSPARIDPYRQDEYDSGLDAVDLPDTDTED